MAITLAQLEAMLDEGELKYSLDNDYVRVNFATEVYRDQDGDGNLFLVLRLDEDGEFLKIMAPNLYRYPLDGPNVALVFRTLLGVSWRSKMLKMNYDERDGEIRATVEIPVEDGSITTRQLFRGINGLVQIVDEYHIAISAAIAGGDASLDGAEQAVANMRLADKVMQAAGVDRAGLVARLSPTLMLEE